MGAGEFCGVRSPCGTTFSHSAHALPVLLQSIAHLVDPGVWCAPRGSEVHTSLLAATEARLADASAPHPHCSTILGFCLDEETGSPKWLLMEPAECDYATFLGSGPQVVTAGTLASHMLQLARGLLHVHATRGPAACLDINLGCVYVSDCEGAASVQLGGVGLAWLLATPPGSAPVLPVFLAPEVTSGHVDTAADIFSLGVLFCTVVFTHLRVPGRACVPHPLASYGLPRRHDMVADAVDHLRALCSPLSKLLAQCCAADPVQRLSSSQLVRVLYVCVCVLQLYGVNCILFVCGPCAGSGGHRWLVK